MAAPVVQSLAEIMAQLEGAYAPSRQIFQQQMEAIPGQIAQQKQGLDVAKGNAFRDVNVNANSKGLAFSGIPAAEQTRYLGEKYLPAVAGVEAAGNNQRTTLQQQLAALFQDQSTRALGTQQGQQTALQQYLADQEKMRFQAQQAALDRQLQASQYSAKNAAEAGSSISYVRNKNGGYDLINGDGTRNSTLDLAGYVKLNGGGVSDLLNFLSEGDKQDKRAVQNFYVNEKKYGQAKALDQLRKDRPTAFYKGGRL